MTTNEQRELAGVSLVSEPTLPTESKHNSDEAHRKAHEMALYQRDLRELDSYQMMEYKQDLTDTLWNPYDTIKNQLKEWDYKTISEEEALHTPRRAA